MDSNAKIYEEESGRFEIDFSALIEAAQREKREKTAEKLAVKIEKNIEETPAGLTLEKWIATPEQIARINRGDREALDTFYFDNMHYIKSLCNSYYMKAGARLRVHAEPLDYMQQIYCDLRTRIVRLRPWDKAIARAIYRSLRFAPVGGVDELYIPYLKEYPLCQN